MSSVPRRCPDAEALAKFAEGQITDDRADELIAHVSSCARCRNAALFAAQLAREPVPSKRWWWIAAAAAVSVCIVAMPFLREQISKQRAKNALREMVDALPRNARLIEPRLSIDSRWASLIEEKRSDATPSAVNLITHGAARHVLLTLESDSSAPAVHAKAIAYFYDGAPRKAVMLLEDVVRRRPRDSRAWSDLAAARYALAELDGKVSVLRDSVAAADTAIHYDQNLTAAYFNRALAVEQLGPPSAAEQAWMRYLKRERDSGWSTEARSHLENLSDNLTP